MMEYKIYDEINGQTMERYELSRDRITEVNAEESGLSDSMKKYFARVSEFSKSLCSTMDMALDNSLYELDINTLKEMNHSFYEEVLGDNYSNSYANPEYAAKELGEEYGPLLSIAYSFLRSCIVKAYKKDLPAITRHLELLLQIYFELCQEEVSPEAIRGIIYYHLSDYADVINEEYVRDITTPEASYQMELLKNYSLDDDRYMYLYGNYVGENELATGKFLRSLRDEELASIARTYTEGYKNGFIAMKIDMSVKEYVDIRYRIGFEKVVEKAIEQFAAMGLKGIIRGVSIESTSPNKQYTYDHRFDHDFFIDKALVDRKADMLEVAFEKRKAEALLIAGPAVIETFGETPFEPAQTPHQIKLDENQRKYSNMYSGKFTEIYHKYVPGETTSFTIIAYPVPEIGQNFEELFSKTIEINNLDSKLYEKIQEKIIDALDKGDYVVVKGKNGNKTDMKVNLWKLKNPDKETIFENCVADVNIPVGEVFTSPVLTGTEGVLNVSSVYLGDLNYKNLTLTFEDGMIKDYGCDNFDTPEAGKSFVKENLMRNKETLPIGEFAIGTNTTAYVIANKYDIVYKLPILIVEKMGPHFAVGDTCYSYSEENKIYNSNGKEVVARENECSVLRDSDPQKAYFNCHTDITIPYDEIGCISVVDIAGNSVDIIRDGRFVLEGCEELNRPFQ